MSEKPTKKKLVRSLLDDRSTLKKVAKEYGLKKKELDELLDEYNIAWFKQPFEASKGQEYLTRLIKGFFPQEKVENEHYLEGSRLDVFVPRYSLAAEYHGRQHFEFVEFFHGDRQGLLTMQRKDREKEELCRKRGIALAVFRYDEPIDEDVVYERLMQAMHDIEDNDEPELSYNERMNERRREYNRRRYRDSKRWKGN